MLFEVQLALGAISVALALILVVLFFKEYWLQRKIFLLGLPFGFLFLTMSYLFLALHFVYPYAGDLSGSLMWLRVITQTGGFLLIAFSYFLSGKIQKTTRYSLLTISLVLVVSVISAFTLLVTIDPPGLSVIYSINQMFTVVNLAFLGYIVFFLVRKFRQTDQSVIGFSAPIAFVIFGLGQLFYLLWELNRSDAALVSSQVARVTSLAIFVGIYYLAIKEASSGGRGQKK